MAKPSQPSHTKDSKDRAGDKTNPGAARYAGRHTKHDEVTDSAPGNAPTQEGVADDHTGEIGTWIEAKNVDDPLGAARDSILLGHDDDDSNPHIADADAHIGDVLAALGGDVEAFIRARERIGDPASSEEIDEFAQRGGPGDILSDARQAQLLGGDDGPSSRLGERWEKFWGDMEAGASGDADALASLARQLGKDTVTQGEAASTWQQLNSGSVGGPGSPGDWDGGPAGNDNPVGDPQGSEGWKPEADPEGAGGFRGGVSDEAGATGGTSGGSGDTAPGSSTGTGSGGGSGETQSSSSSFWTYDTVFLVISASSNSGVATQWTGADGSTLQVRPDGTVELYDADGNLVYKGPAEESGIDLPGDDDAEEPSDDSSGSTDSGESDSEDESEEEGDGDDGDSSTGLTAADDVGMGPVDMSPPLLTRHYPTRDPIEPLELGELVVGDGGVVDPPPDGEEATVAVVETPKSPPIDFGNPDILGYPEELGPLDPNFGTGPVSSGQVGSLMEARDDGLSNRSRGDGFDEGKIPGDGEDLGGPTG